MKKALFRSHQNTTYATYLRAIAALGVLSIHYGGFGLRYIGESGTNVNKFFNQLIDFGGQGPVIFFVASGYVLYLTYSEKICRNPLNILQILIVRWFRLAPMYFFVSLLTYIFLIQEYNLKVTFKLVLEKILFLELFFNNAIKFSPISIGNWIIVEFWLSIFLLLIPIIFRLGKSNIFCSVFFIALSFCLHYGIRYLSKLDESMTLGDFETNFYILSQILKNQFFFVLGMTACSLKNRIKIPLKSLVVFIFICFALIYVLQNYKSYLAAFLAVLILQLESTLNYSNEVQLKKQNIFGICYSTIKKSLKKTFLLLGNSCYSIYLMHVPMLGIFSQFFLSSNSISKVLIALLVIMLSCLTFVFIEIPFNNLGKKLIRFRKV